MRWLQISTAATSLGKWAFRCHAGALDVPAGSQVITEGEIGDRFYVIASGGVEVLGDGARIRTQGPGESFGETALLRDVPRTATVRTLESTRLLAIERHRFLQSVTGHADSHDVATEIADRFLAAPADTPA
jgi:CRP-like cAMP-binding protein